MVPVMLLVEVDRAVWGIIGGATIVVASHEIDRVSALATRSVTVVAGRVTEVR
jgi:ABC-type ATPase involved in cell division